MELSSNAQNVYPFWWALARDAAATKDTQGAYQFQVTDLQSAAADLAKSQNIPLSFGDRAGISSLFGIARTMEVAADRLTAANDQSPIRSEHISEAPWSRKLNVQTTSPEWHLVAQITYRAPDGTVVTDWGTGVFPRTLPTTVGYLRQEAELQFRRMLSKRDELKNTGGELLSVGRTYLIAV